MGTELDKLIGTKYRGLIVDIKIKSPVIKEVLERVPDCLRILEYYYEEPEDFPTDEMYADKYCVTPPDYVESEFD